MASIHICPACHRQLQADEVVVVAAQQIDASHQQDPTATVDGPRSLFHEQHWFGDTELFKERARGTLRELTSGSAR